MSDRADAQMAFPAPPGSEEGAREPFWVQDHPPGVSEPSKRAPVLTRCPHCNGTWTGLTTCHCSSCHRTFSSISAFDMHRSGSHAESTRHCVDPASAGLVPVTKLYWSGWARPGERPPPE